MRHICDKATADGIADEHEYDRYGVCFLLHDLGHKIGTGHDYVWCHADQLFGEGPRLVGIGASPAGINPDVAPFGPTQFLKPLPECRSAGVSFRVAFAISQQQTDVPHPLRLLRAHFERPRYRRGTNKRDELAPFHTATPKQQS